MSSLNDAQLFDKSFVLTMIGDLRRLLIYMPIGLYGKEIFGTYVYKAESKVTNAITLNLLGTAMVIYYQVFKEMYPEKNASNDQIERMNAVWQAIGHPENIIPV